MTTRARNLCFLAVLGASLLGAAAVALASADARPASAKVAPVNVKFLVNGKRYATTKLIGGQDTYLPVKWGRIRVEARWVGNLTGSGYYVVMSTTYPSKRDYATCRTGTSCVVPQRVAIGPGGEMSWTVKILRTGSKRLVKGHLVCLIGRA